MNQYYAIAATVVVLLVLWFKSRCEAYSSNYSPKPRGKNSVGYYGGVPFWVRSKCEPVPIWPQTIVELR